MDKYTVEQLQEIVKIVDEWDGSIEEFYKYEKEIEETYYQLVEQGVIKP